MTAFLLVSPSPSAAYAVLAHEALIDAAWETNVKPLLHKRFPEATEEDLSNAQAFAYGGSIIQDMGYYPYGSHFFSDLTHYVRSGDFILALIRDAKDVDEYAFALGALSHYAADTDGHSKATNVAEPILYPRLRKKFGNVIYYEQDPLAHVKTEFGFDVLEVAAETYAPDEYHDFIGFEVAQDLLDRAFCETYGLELKNLLRDEDKALSSYRHAVSSTIPSATKIAWSLKEKDIVAASPGITRNKFLYRLSRSRYQKEWGKNYQQPTFKERFLAFLYQILPKIGPLRVLQFRTPTPQTQDLFRKSLSAALDRYQHSLAELGTDDLHLPNTNFDVGQVTAPGKYQMNDAAHAKLLDKLAQQKFASVSPDLRKTLLDFYADPDAPDTMKAKPKVWATVQAQVAELKNTAASASAAAGAVDARP